jgi:type II secretory pathway predicted ATPase ExeA
MYEEFWGLKSLPFENVADPQTFLESGQHLEALSRLLYVVQERKACGVLTSPYGCGKTLVMRRLFVELAPRGYRFSGVNNPRLSDLDMLRMILHGFTREQVPAQKADVLMALENVFTQTARDGKHSVVMIDEAHAIEDPAVFEELRLLLNFQTDKHYMVSLLIAGQPELTAKIDNNKQFNQRISVKYQLAPLSAEESAQYIDFRLKQAGAKANLFSPENVQLIKKFSGGIPRWINNICHMTLMNAFLRGSRVVTNEIISETNRSFGQHSP